MGDQDLRFYLSILWRRLPYAMAITAVISLIVTFVAIMMPDLYRASAKILAEAPLIPAKLARSTVSTDVAGQLQILQQQAMTTENLVELAKKLNLHGKDEARFSEADIADEMRERTAFEFLPLDPSLGAEGTTILTVSFDAADPVLAANVVNELVAFMLGGNARQRTGMAGDTLRFFTNEAERLKADLAKIEADILKFKNENRNTLPDDLDFRRNQQIRLQEKLMVVEREEAELRARRARLVEAFETTGFLANSAPATPEQQMLQDLNRALTDQLAIFAEDSPTIQALRGRIAALRHDMQSPDRTDENGKGVDKPLSPLDLQLFDFDNRLKYVDEVKPGLTQAIADLSATIAATPKNATILNAMERNRDNVLTQYNAAVASLAEASTGQEIEMRAKGVRFSILEPAAPPQNRLNPKRRKIAVIGFLGAACLGLGFVGLLEFLNNTIRRPTELAEALQIQPLATIPYMEISQKRRLGGAGAASGRERAA